MRTKYGTRIRSGIAAALLGAAIAGAAVAPSSAQEVFTIQGGAVQQWGGDIVQAWAEKHNLKVEFITGSVDPHHTRLFQEASLNETSIDMAILLSRFLNENIANLFEPLDDLQAANPIEDIDGISPGMRQAMTYDGSIYGIPWRHATEALHMNTALLKERGLTEYPKTFEEVLEYAEKLTYKRDDGTQVHGLIFEGPTVASLSQFYRSYGADFMTTDMQVVADSPEMIAAMNQLKKFYDEGVLPTGFLNFIPPEDATAMMQQGRAAMVFSPFGRTFNYANRDASKFPEDMAVIAVPPLAGHEAPATKTEFWAYVIPANSTKKELAWDLIRELSTLESTVTMAAEKGNGPVREAAYADPRVRAAFTYADADAEASAVAGATPPLPGFAKSAQAADYFTEAVQSILIGAASAEDAMKELAVKTRALLK
jgi:multiple sugar transport system substrate-binding protein